MGVKLIHVGFGNYINGDRIVAIATRKSAPVKRSVQDARSKGLIIDLTEGRKGKSIIFTDAEYLVLSGLEPGTINGRIADDVQQ